ncbi:MAG: lipoprotein insertase outer membrane protein LolB [Acidiferrobacterales bacterium]
MRIPALLLLSALLIGCSTTAVRLTEAERQTAWQNHLQKLNASHRWSMRGRVALQTDDRGWQARISWVKSERKQHIQLSGPFGGSVVALTQDRNGAVLRDNRGNEYMDSDAERLLQQVTGWKIPINGLQYWVRGQAIPNVNAKLELDEIGRLKSLKQNNWEIRYLAYARYGQLQLPRRIFMSRLVGDGSGRILEVRLALNRWQSDP